MSKIDRHWETTDDGYALYGSFCDPDEELLAELRSCVEPDDTVAYRFSSDFMSVEDEPLVDADDIDGAKDAVEDAIENYLRDQFLYYKHALESWCAGGDSECPLTWKRVNELPGNGFTNEFECPYCNSIVRTEIYLRPGRSPDYNRCPYCGNAVN